MHCVFRVDASLTMGTGHMMRCLTLAKHLRNMGAHVLFASRLHEGHLCDFIEQLGFFVYRLPVPVMGFVAEQVPSHARWLGVDWQQDADEFMEVFAGRDKQVDWLIVDHYALDYRWEQYVRSLVKQILVIDDLADRKHDCDLLLDQSFGRCKNYYRPYLLTDCQQLLGSEYALLRSQFAKIRQKALKKRASSTHISNILISMGGVDPDNITSLVIQGLETITWPGTVCIDVVLGGTPHHEQVRELALKSHLKINVLSDVLDMAGLMVNADLAIGAGGTTAWERCSLGLPTLVVITADNQKFLVKNLVSVGAIISLGKSAQVTVKSFAKAVGLLLPQKRYYEKMVTAAFSICDGLGVERVAGKIFRQSTNYCLRMAREEDCKLVFTWQANPKVRQYFRNPEVPSWQEHRSWFYQSVKDSDRELFIIECESQAVGVIRLDKIKEEKVFFEISILVALEWQGRGVGLEVLRSLRKSRPEDTFIAKVLEKNTVSKKLFTSAGYASLDHNQFISKGIVTSKL